MPQPSRIISMTGPAIPGELADDSRQGQAVLSLTSGRARRYIAEMKWRNQLLALFCLLGFGGLGILYFQHWVVQKPFGIILFVGEGLTPHRLAATRAYLAGADGRLELDQMPHVALLTN